MHLLCTRLIIHVFMLEAHCACVYVRCMTDACVFVGVSRMCLAGDACVFAGVSRIEPDDTHLYRTHTHMHA